MGRLSGKIAVVTGGVSGIALGVVEMYVAEGAKLIVADIQAEKGAQLEARFPGSVYFNRCDIRNEEDIARTMAMAEEKFGGLDIVLHAAASVDHKQKIADLTTEAWDDGQANLLRSHVMSIKHAIGPMQKRGGGSVILVSSAAAENFSPAASMVYVVCKGAVLYLARWAAFELASSNIRVNAIVPGAYATSMWGQLVGASKEVADIMPAHLDEMMSGSQPLPKPGKPLDIAYAATYLGSDESAFVTGTHLAVDGGLSIFRPAVPREKVMDYLQQAKAQAEEDLLDVTKTN
ncbi:SDR family NAD(P)-dependent oxidoreductase [Rhizorhapis suberifaciens]|uniref:NAD(P)-dependent dehydrogenase (Short-subunit alcohol dehydrogenase family) n=1 Tax=Rhizorhapis suberifaciens TaxID=13656 RepID=A0A840HZD3_9SPHN|nr:SDR family oxidoreductase [Rhizorhapis suberifaciens]MBB4643011.1 NAD(P)-dependent dehydrogenase (short-subunit alcohol dehydrogenase family) [Rhizorhapis suberifaciens]